MASRGFALRSRAQRVAFADGRRDTVSPVDGKTIAVSCFTDALLVYGAFSPALPSSVGLARLLLLLLSSWTRRLKHCSRATLPQTWPARRTHGTYDSVASWAGLYLQMLAHAPPDLIPPRRNLGWTRPNAGWVRPTLHNVGPILGQFRPTFGRDQHHLGWVRPTLGRVRTNWGGFDTKCVLGCTQKLARFAHTLAGFV